MNKRFSLLFYFKKPKRYSKKELPIYMRISIDSRRAEVSTKRTWDPIRWNVAAGRAIGTKETAKELNAYLDTLQGKVYEIQRELIASNQEVTVENIKTRFEGRKKASRMFLEIFMEHNDRMNLLVKKDFAPATLVRYKTALRHTSDFIWWKYKKRDIDIGDLSYEFATDFEFWLKSIRNCGHNTAMKYISNMKKIVHLCIKNGWLSGDPFVGYRMQKREVIREILTQEEIDKIAAKTFPTDRLNIVRDIFLFSCYTGLAYADVRRLKSSEVAAGVDGEKWIFTKRTKTEVPSRIPLLGTPLRIIEKYEDHPLCRSKGRLLPTPSNQKMNAYLKEIADLCGITKKITFHIARHTFATTVTLTNGVPIETVGKMLGHRNLKTTQHYAKILDKKVSEDMKLLKQRISQTPGKLDYHY